MSIPLSFQARSARIDLPFLFAAQAQKEPTLNEAIARIDALLHPVVQGEANIAPDEADDGECWIVGPEPQGPWSDRSGEIASLSGGAWLFAGPLEGMQVFDRQQGTLRWWHGGGWQSCTLPAHPNGGTTIDGEARAALSALLDALHATGIGV